MTRSGPRALEVRARRHGRRGLAHPGARARSASRPPSPRRRDRRRAGRRRRARRRRGSRGAHRLGITEQELAQQGLRITTTLDPRRQRQAVDAVHDALAGQPANLRSAMVAIDPQTGGILAYYGGENGARPRLRAGRAARGLHVQAVRRARRPAGEPAGRARHHVRGRVRARPAQRRGRELHALRPEAGDDALQQRGVQLPREAGRRPGRRRRRPRRGRHHAARRPDEIALGNKEISARRPRLGLRDDRRRRRLAPPHLVASVVDDRRARALPGRPAASGGSPSRSPATSPRRCSRSPPATGWRCPADGRSRPAPAPCIGRRGPAQRRLDGRLHALGLAAGVAGHRPQRARSAPPRAGRSPARTCPATRGTDFMTDATAGRPDGRVRPGPTPTGAPPSDLPPDLDPPREPAGRPDRLRGRTAHSRPPGRTPTTPTRPTRPTRRNRRRAHGRPRTPRRRVG